MDRKQSCGHAKSSYILRSAADNSYSRFVSSDSTAIVSVFAYSMASAEASQHVHLHVQVYGQLDK